MSKVFGIYFGNSTLSIATSKEDGKVEILANDAGDRVTPAVVKITAKEEVVGIAAVSGLSARSPNVVKFNKRFLDLDITPESLERAKTASLVKVESEEGKHVYLIQDEERTLKYTPVQVATLEFAKLYGIAQAACHGGKNLSCVLCVPRHWSKETRDEVVEAAESAGWNILQVASETSVAPLAYRLDTLKKDMKILVFRLGGVSAEATVIEFKQGFLCTRSSARSDEIGGESILSVVRNHVADEFQRKYHLNPRESRKSMLKISSAAESIIQVLSTLTQSSKFIESVCEGIDFSFNLSRARLESLVSPLLASLTQPIKDALAEAQVSTKEIEKVILAGGPLKMPKLASYVGSLFPADAEVLSSIAADEVLAIGAAFQASYLANIPDCEPLHEPTFNLPFLESPIIVTFSTGDEVKFEGVPIPSERTISLQKTTDDITVTARQLIQDRPKGGKVTIKDLPSLNEVKLHLKITLQNELIIETDPGMGDLQQHIIEMKFED